ncbi:hypothetical protein LTR36_003302 [Oleoguttula mirabilis]|uniref:Uncharacterized protein n=1 Tax=Oleoguttula mirabilis TaxID=1507867 RepID=A0AAV9JXP0_9PEZI|nr:hypothetical protein LTR36_003302 [Oleoguttula mirabilis]
MACTRPTPEELHSTHSTNPTSKFKPFCLKLANGATLTGISYIPGSVFSTSASPGKPLLVGIHGATCSAYSYDVSPNYTASTYCDLIGVPFVAFNRPNYLDSSGWLVDRSSADPQTPQWKPEQGNSFFEEEGRWLHDYTLPALWSAFALPNDCTSIVTTSHSMSVPVTVIAASHYSPEPPSECSYTWSGMILSGFAERPEARAAHGDTVSAALLTDGHREPHEIPLGQDDRIHIVSYKPEDKMNLMLGPVGVSDPDLRPLIWKQHTPFLLQEIVDMMGPWPAASAKYKAGVKIPVLVGLGEYDWVWQGTRESVERFCTGFDG